MIEPKIKEGSFIDVLRNFFDNKINIENYKHIVIGE